MRWRSFKIGGLKIAVGELRSIHTCNNRDYHLPGTFIVGEYVSIYWKGKQKIAQIIRLIE